MPIRISLAFSEDSTNPLLETKCFVDRVAGITNESSQLRIQLNIGRINAKFSGVESGNGRVLLERTAVLVG